MPNTDLPTVIITGASSGVCRPLQVLLTNAAVYLPGPKAPRRSPEGHEIGGTTNLAFAQPLSAEADDAARSSRLWRLSEKLVGLE